MIQQFQVELELATFLAFNRCIYFFITAPPCLQKLYQPNFSLSYNWFKHKSLLGERWMLATVKYRINLSLLHDTTILLPVTKLARQINFIF